MYEHNENEIIGMKVVSLWSEHYNQFTYTLQSIIIIAVVVIRLSFALLSSFFFGAVARIIIIVMRCSIRCRHHRTVWTLCASYIRRRVTATATTATTTTTTTMSTSMREMRIRKRNNARWRGNKWPHAYAGIR